jgi:uncharacterized cupredoxin-like copper-binding protein
MNTLTLLALGLFPILASASGTHSHRHEQAAEQTRAEHANADSHSNMHAGHHGSPSAGEPGRAADVVRTIEVEANDRMRFLMSELTVRAGETLKFVITNTGQLPHEFSVGTAQEHKVHQKMMEQMPGMQHGEVGPSVSVPPGMTRALIWKFTHAGELEAACNMPGHYQAGMRRTIRVGGE